ncbi:hypothetical protein Q9L58_010245 [Maublancomyces gigas]|uniref:Uncharacterized protein n=1 Tax=Discina gigas TaxID=1032678 RepID=A0ABR3G513_9PEZI
MPMRRKSKPRSTDPPRLPIVGHQAKRLLADYHAPISCNDLTSANIRPKDLLTFMRDAGLIKTRNVITNNSHARAADYKHGADI